VESKPLTGKALLAVRNSDASVIAYEGSVRSSKTHTSILQWIGYARTGPPGTLLMVGRTERTIRQNVIDPMTELLGRARCRYVAGQGVLHLMGRRILVVGANDEAAVTKIQGLTLSGAYVDEAATIPESFFEMLHTRLSVDGAKLFLTSNPASPAHWLKKKWLDRARLWIDRDGKFHHNSDGLDLHRVTFVLDDNPHLPAGYIQRVKNSYTGLFYRRYILAEWVAAEGSCYDMFDPEKHVAPSPLILHWPAVGVDHGTKNPFSAVLLGIGVDGRLHITSEYRWDSSVQRRQKTDVEYSADVAQWLDNYIAPGGTEATKGVSPEKIVVDPSASNFIAQLWNDGWSPVKADNAVLDGIRLVSSLLHRDLLRIDPSCTGLIEEFPSYCWDDKAALKGVDKPLKIADHGLDAARYALKTTEWTWRDEIGLPAAA
jgi:PBSX family phage terminase large subunit